MHHNAQVAADEPAQVHPIGPSSEQRAHCRATSIMSGIVGACQPTTEPTSDGPQPETRRRINLPTAGLPLWTSQSRCHSEASEPPCGLARPPEHKPIAPCPGPGRTDTGAHSHRPGQARPHGQPPAGHQAAANVGLPRGEHHRRFLQAPQRRATPAHADMASSHVRPEIGCPASNPGGSWWCSADTPRMLYWHLSPTGSTLVLHWHHIRALHWDCIGAAPVPGARAALIEGSAPTLSRYYAGAPLLLH